MRKLVFLAMLLAGFLAQAFANDFNNALAAYAKGDYVTSFKLSNKSCKAGEALGCYGLGVMYEKGHGAKQSFRMAKELYGKACDMGLQLGCDDYADLNRKGY